MEAKIVQNAIKINKAMFIDGFYWLSISYEGTYESFKKCPSVLEFDGRKYSKMSHNSDIMEVCYRTGIPFAMAV